MDTKFDLEQFYSMATRIYEKARAEGRLLSNPNDHDLREILDKKPEIRKTIYNNYATGSEPTSRSAMFTRNSVDFQFGTPEIDLMRQCEIILRQQRLISCDCQVGSQENNTTVRLIVPEGFAHVVMGGRNLFRPLSEVLEKPTYQIVYFADSEFEANHEKPLAQKDITIRLAMLPDGRYVKIIRNGNYIGEFKKGVFAAEDWAAKTRKGGIFLHAGCREDYLENVHGDYQLTRTLLVALSANGKTTTTSRILAKKGHEKSWLVQDDGGTFLPNGAFHGFEGGGIYVKTEGVNPGEQTEIYYGLLKPDTVCENVQVTEQGDFDFYDFQRTSNGRAVVRRQDSMHASAFIDVDKVDNLVLITRGPLIPAISKLNPAQTAALMVLGQAMESSAGDPTKAGQIRSEFFYDPFIAGDRAAHANLFYSIIRGLPNLNFYLLNTGWLGEGDHYLQIRLETTMGILDSLMRGGLDEWVDSPTGLKIPRAIRTVDDIYLHPERLYSIAEFSQKQERLNQLRREAVEKVGPELHPDVKAVFSSH
jgi:phosphoenolpyruvate carboxykinase (ATP)